MQAAKKPSGEEKQEKIPDKDNHQRDFSHEERLRRLGMALRSIGGACQGTYCIGVV